MDLWLGNQGLEGKGQQRDVCLFIKNSYEILKRPPLSDRKCQCFLDSGEDSLVKNVMLGVILASI